MGRGRSLRKITARRSYGCCDAVGFTQAVLQADVGRRRDVKRGLNGGDFPAGAILFACPIWEEGRKPNGQCWFLVAGLILVARTW